MRIPKKLATPVALIGMSIGILSSAVPMVTYAAESPEIQYERYMESEEETEINPVTEDIVYEVKLPWTKINFKSFVRELLYSMITLIHMSFMHFVSKKQEEETM